MQLRKLFAGFSSDTWQNGEMPLDPQEFETELAFDRNAHLRLSEEERQALEEERQGDINPSRISGIFPTINLPTQSSGAA